MELKLLKQVMVKGPGMRHSGWQVESSETDATQTESAFKLLVALQASTRTPCMDRPSRAELK